MRSSHSWEEEFCEPAPAQPLHSWEQVASHSWDEDGEIENDADYSSSDEEETYIPSQAGQMLVDLLLTLLWCGTLTAKSLCIICYWAQMAGCQSPISDFAKPPGHAFGNYQKQIDRVLGVNLHDKSQYAVATPMHLRFQRIRSVRRTVVRPAHHVLDHEARNRTGLYGDLVAAIRDNEWGL